MNLSGAFSDVVCFVYASPLPRCNMFMLSKSVGSALTNSSLPYLFTNLNNLTLSFR